MVFSNLSFGQDSGKTAEPKALEELKGFTQTFYYSTGQEARARSIAELMENAGDFFHEEIGFTPKTKLYILSSGDWKGIAAGPLQEVYGFPHNIDQVRLVVAAEDNDFWRSFLPPVDQLPPSMIKKVKKAFGNPDDSYSMMPFFDLLALHEMGHSYTAQAGLKMHRKWMGELFVNIMLHNYVAEMQPEWLPALETFPGMVVGAGSAEYKFTTLEDFEKLYSTMGMGPKNYGWYQSQLNVKAKDIYEAGGKMVLKKLWKALKEHQEEMTDEKFVNMLQEEVHPSVAGVYLKWDSME